MNVGLSTPMEVQLCFNGFNLTGLVNAIKLSTTQYDIFVYLYHLFLNYGYI